MHIGDDVTERLDYQPSSLFVNSYVRPKYACGDCQCDGCGVHRAEALGVNVDPGFINMLKRDSGRDN